MQKSDATAVASVLEILARLQCPEVTKGEGSSLFPIEVQGEGTPDLIAGPFYGRSDPRTFYIDVWTPTGDYFVDSSAGAAPTAEFVRSLFATLAKNVAINKAIHMDYARVLLRAVFKKSEKYAAKRDGSPLFGAVAFFTNTGQAQNLFAAMTFPRAVHEELGPVPFEKLLGHFLGNRGSGITMACLDVSWDLPLAFLVQVHRGADFATCTLFRNNHARLAAFADHPVMVWSKELVEAAKASLVV